MSIIKGNGYEIRQSKAGGSRWETLTLFPKRALPEQSQQAFCRELRLRRVIRRHDGHVEYSVSLFASNGTDLIASALAESIEKIRIERCVYSNGYALWLDRASFDISIKEQVIVSSWLFPGPPLPECWSTLNGISRPNSERTLQDFAREKFARHTGVHA